MKSGLMAFAVATLLATGCRRPEATQRPVRVADALTNPADTSDMPDWGRHIRSGTELLALGEEPFWSVEINPNRYMRFRNVDGDSLLAPVPQRLTDTNGSFRYDAQTEAGRLLVIFRADSCRSSMSGQVFPYHVQVEAKGKLYSGCGVTLVPLMLLNDNWVLERYRDTPVQVGTFGPSIPQLELNTSDKRVAGTSGCNRITGSVRADGSRIRFGPMAGTRMACPANGALSESVFLEALQASTGYRIGNNRLTLYRGDTAELVFRRVD